MLDTGLEIRILREKLKMSAKELAEKVGLSQSQMSRLEKGQRRIDMKVLERIAEALEVSPSHFFRGTDAPAGGVIPPTVPETVGRLIRSERRQRHVSAEDLARKLGKPKSVIESIEDGKRELDPELADRILRVLKLPSNYLLGAQQQIIRALEGQVERLNEAISEVSRGGRILESADRGEGAAGEGDEVRRRAGTPILGSIAEGYPQRFDDSGRPLAEISEFLHIPELGHEDAFALHVVGDSMEGDGAPCFREGDLVVFRPGTLRSRDFCFVRIQGTDATFRQIFFDPSGQIRIQPVNLNYPSRVVPKEQVLATWRLVGHVARF